MKYCACWHYDDMLLGMLIPIKIIVYLHRTKILCFNNQFTSSYNVSSIVVLSCSVYSSDVNMITYNPLVVLSVVFVSPLFTDSTKESILSLIQSRTNWCISSNASEGVDFCDYLIMFQLLKDPNTDQ